MLASNERSQSLIQVIQKIEQVLSLVQTNSVISQELSSQASILKELLNKFKLKEY